MNSPFEGPQLGIKTLKGPPDNWLARGIGATSRILTLAMDDEVPYFPNSVEFVSWQYLPYGEVTIKDPDASYDAVFITNILDRYEPPEQKKLLAEAARVTRNGGKVAAYSPACDDAKEVRELAASYGMDVSEFDSRRLTNKGIARLRPHEAMFFLGSIVIPNRKRLVQVLRSMGLPATLEHMWEVRDRFAIRRFHVGMTWYVERG